MGHGGARELETAQGPLPELDPAEAARLDAAMAKMDALDPQFKSSRDDERLAQMSKLWNATCKEIDEHLRTSAKLLVQTHQLSLDMGSDGGGIAIKPWIEDTQGKFQRLMFRLSPGHDSILISIGGKDVGTGVIADVSFEWVIKNIVEWLVYSVDHRR